MTTEAPATTHAPLQVSAVWKNVDAGLAAELTAFWLQHGAIADEAEAVRRVSDVVCVGRDANGRICTVSSVTIKVLPRLLQPMYYYRMFVAPAARGHRHTTPMYNQSVQALQAYNAALPQPESLGVLIELENTMLEKKSQQVHIAELDSTFIGYSPRGLHLRVTYFKGAVLLPPATPGP